MAGRGPTPKNPAIRQRTNRKAGSAELQDWDGKAVPPIPNPGRRRWHPLTVRAWRAWWTSPMRSQWVDADVYALGHVAILLDMFYREPDAKLACEIRLQTARWGLSSVDRARLQWSFPSDQTQRRAADAAGGKPKRVDADDPRRLLMQDHWPTKAQRPQ